MTIALVAALSVSLVINVRLYLKVAWLTTNLAKSEYMRDYEYAVARRSINALKGQLSRPWIDLHGRLLRKVYRPSRRG